MFACEPCVNLQGALDFRELRPVLFLKGPRGLRSVRFQTLLATTNRTPPPRAPPSRETNHAPLENLIFSTFLKGFHEFLSHRPPAPPRPKKFVSWGRGSCSRSASLGGGVRGGDAGAFFLLRQKKKNPGAFGRPADCNISKFEHSPGKTGCSRWVV